jgi:predicted choloylglycine hydrolase
MRYPPEILRQLDELCERYGMNRTQVVLMLIAKEYGATTTADATQARADGEEVRG